MIRRDENGFWHTADADIGDVEHALGLDIYEPFDTINEEKYDYLDNYIIWNKAKKKREERYSYGIISNYY